MSERATLAQDDLSTHMHQFTEACLHGDLSRVRKLASTGMLARNGVPAYVLKESFREAFQRNHLEIVKFLINKYRRQFTKLVAENLGWLELESATNNLESLHWLVHHSGLRFELQKPLEGLLISAADTGVLGIIRWIFVQAPVPIPLYFGEAAVFQIAAHSGHLELLQWLLTAAEDEITAARGSCLSCDLSRLYLRCLRATIHGGHDALYHWLTAHAHQRQITYAYHELIIPAIQADRPEYIELFQSYVRHPIKFWTVQPPHANSSLGFACDYGSYEVANWLIEESGQLDELLQAEQVLRHAELLPFQTLQLLLFYGFGIELDDGLEDNFEELAVYFQKLQQMQSTDILPSSQLTALLKRFDIPRGERRPYFRSVLCRRAADSRMIQTREQLDTFLERLPKRTSARF